MVTFKFVGLVGNKCEPVSCRNATVWVTREGVEHFLGDPDVLHATSLLLGIVAIVFAKRLPMLLAAVASTSLGLWVGLVVQDLRKVESLAIPNQRKS